MHCEEARAALLDHLDAPPGAAGNALDAHLEGCAECRALEDDILTMRARARVWHEISPPAWNPNPRPWQTGGIGRPEGWLPLALRWLPLAASTAALVLAVGAFRQPAEPPPPAAARSPFANVTSPDTAALLATSRQERRQEMEALTALLKAELDRQSLETEQSLKYIIAHQIQSQRELDEMRGQLLQTGAVPSEQL